MEYLVFENANLQCKIVISPLKETSAIIDEWIRNPSDIGSNSYDATLVDVISQRF